MKSNLLKKMTSVFIFAVVFSLQASAATDCPQAVRSKLSGPRLDLISCLRDDGLYFVLQDYQGEDQIYAGITLSVYDATGASSSLKPLAVQDGLGDGALKFKYAGRIENQVVLESGQGGNPVILFRAFNPPSNGVFFSYRFDRAESKLDLISDETSTDAGSIPEIRADGSMEIRGTQYDADGVQEKYDYIYQLKDGKFSPRNR